MTLKEYREFQQEAVDEAMERNVACEREFGLSVWDRWDCDLDLASLTFSRGGVTGVVASIQVVGSTSNKTNSWLWSWANETIPEVAREEIERVRAFGEVERITCLTDERMPAGEDTGWEMASVAARLLGAKGTYRCPGESGYLYLVYMDLAQVFGSAMVQ